MREGCRISRRTFVAGAAALLPTLVRPIRAAGAERLRTVTLVAAPARLPLVGPPHPDTEVWAYGGSVPGPEIRVRQGDRLRIAVENRLPEETTVHWHGLRVPNAMDGVPHLTQAPIRPGETFVYAFDCLDAGTFWYHPHQGSSGQVGRGLYGALVVEERLPVPVDRDVTWVLGDFRLRPDAAISEDFGNLHDMSHAGRIGNTVTVNGRIPETFTVRAGERLRLRLINVANARIFGLEFTDHDPRILALDGQPVAPHRPEEGRIVLGPGMRADVLLDLTGAPGSRARVLDTFYRGREYRLLDLVYADAPPVRERPEPAPVSLPANPLAEPDLGAAARHEIVLAGGMMGRMRSALVDGARAPLRVMMQRGLAWAINDVAASGHAHAPLLVLRRGGSYVLHLVNDTAWHHPMHLHGHVFRVLARNGRPTRYREWQDTLLLAPQEQAEIAFVADNPGDWMLHCHVLEHQAGGMSAVIRVA